MGRKRIFSGIALIVLCVLGAGYYFFFTSGGSTVLVRGILRQYADTGNIEVVSSQGALAEELSWQDIEIKELPWLPSGSIIQVKRLDISFSSLSMNGVTVRIHNGRIMLPETETVIFYGTYENDHLDFNVYTKKAGLRILRNFFPHHQELKNVSGRVDDLDVSVIGSVFTPQVRGTFLIREFARNEFTLKNAPATFWFDMRKKVWDRVLNGEIFLAGGDISARGRPISLAKSRLIFSGNPKEPALDVTGSALVEATRIDIRLTGTAVQPQLRLSSRPSLPEGQLLLMLATGKNWRSAKRSLNEKHITPDLAFDFVDFLLLGGKGSLIAEKFGIQDISVTLNGVEKEIRVKKNITDNTAVSYGISQSQEDKNAGEAKHKVGATVDITDTLSVEGQKEIRPENGKGTRPETKGPPDDKVLLKFKKEF